MLGVRLERTRLVALAGAALLTSTAVSAVGVIGFVGLVAPHAARFLVGGRHARVLPVAALLGAGLVSLADTLGRTVIAPAQIPAGLVTALVGTPYFVWLLYRSGRTADDHRAKEDPMTDVAPWRFFAVRVAQTERLSPSFLRVTFTGPELDLFADNGYDQRIKLVVPLPDSGVRHLPTGPDWYARWRALPAEQRNPVRTYTVRAVRPHLGEVDLDIVLHGDVGPASRWAGSVEPGEALALLGPDARYDGRPRRGGVPATPRHHRPPAGRRRDRCPGDRLHCRAAPARHPGRGAARGGRGRRCARRRRAAGVHRDLAAPRGRPARRPAGPAVRAAADRLLDPAPLPEPVDLPEPDVDTDVLWEVPDEPAAGRPYVWLAGEAAMIRDLRRYLVAERGLDRRSVAFMGYWRVGRTEDGT